MCSLSIKELETLCKEVRNLAVSMDKAFEVKHTEEHLDIAIMAGISQAYIRGFREGRTAI